MYDESKIMICFFIHFVKYTWKELLKYPLYSCRYPIFRISRMRRQITHTNIFDTDISYTYAMELCLLQYVA